MIYSVCFFLFKNLNLIEMEYFLTVKNITNEMKLLWNQRNERTIERIIIKIALNFIWQRPGHKVCRVIILLSWKFRLIQKSCNSKSSWIFIEIAYHRNTRITNMLKSAHSCPVNKSEIYQRARVQLSSKAQAQHVGGPKPKEKQDIIR